MMDTATDLLSMMVAAAWQGFLLLRQAGSDCCQNQQRFDSCRGVCGGPLAFIVPTLRHALQLVSHWLVLNLSPATATDLSKHDAYH
jgi:hypothetical protein